MRSDSERVGDAHPEIAVNVDPATPPSDRIRWVEHRGERILRLDFSGFQEPKAALAVIDQARAFIATQPEGSLLTLTDVTGSQFNVDVARGFWEIARANRPYVIAGAVVGLSPGMQQDLYHLVVRLSRRTLPAFDDAERAKDWLVEQKREKEQKQE